MKSIKNRIQVGNILISLMIKIIISKRVALCRRYHKAALIAEPDLTSGSRFFGIKNACGMEISMKYKVNELCIGCGLCEAACPEVFSLKDGGTAVAVDTDVPKESEANAKEAMTGCPVGAIEEI